MVSSNISTLQVKKKMRIKTALVCIILLCSMVSPCFAETTIHDLTVDDKHIVFNYLDTHHILHTREFGDIRVSDTVYEKVWINDTITVDINSWGNYDVQKINGKPIYEI